MNNNSSNNANPSASPRAFQQPQSHGVMPLSVNASGVGAPMSVVYPKYSQFSPQRGDATISTTASSHHGVPFSPYNTSRDLMSSLPLAPGTTVISCASPGHVLPSPCSPGISSHAGMPAGSFSGHHSLLGQGHHLSSPGAGALQGMLQQPSHGIPMSGMTPLGHSVQSQTQFQSRATSSSIDASQYPSVGSVGHCVGACKRCVFYSKGKCRNGHACQFCHLPHPKPPRRRKDNSDKTTKHRGSGGCGGTPPPSIRKHGHSKSGHSLQG